jgi:hypothetical protein
MNNSLLFLTFYIYWARIAPRYEWNSNIFLLALNSELEFPTRKLKINDIFRSNWQIADITRHKYFISCISVFCPGFCACLPLKFELFISYMRLITAHHRHMFIWNVTVYPFHSHSLKMCQECDLLRWIPGEDNQDTGVIFGTIRERPLYSIFCETIKVSFYFLYLIYLFS